MQRTGCRRIIVGKRHRRFGAISSLMMVSLFVLLVNTANADIIISDFKPGSCGVCSLEVKIQGDIKKSDLEILKDKITKAPERCNEIKINAELDSRGGDIEAAMGIGHLFRKHEARVQPTISPEVSCLSACVFLVAGAVDRGLFTVMEWFEKRGTPLPFLGIHRPYFYDSKNMTGREMEMRYKKMIGQIRDYFREMNIPEALADAMVSVPPGEIKTLSFDEANKFLLTQKDPVHEELEIARAASIYGLTSSEWRKRKESAEKTCTELTHAQGTATFKADQGDAALKVVEFWSSRYPACVDKYTLNLSPEQILYFRSQQKQNCGTKQTREECLKCYSRAYQDASRIK